MVGNVASTPFQGLRNIQNSHERYVQDGGGFRPASQGSFLGKVVSWLNETFRPGHVKQQNAQAYAAAKQAFMAEGGSQAQADSIFNSKMATGAKFSPADIRPALRQGFDAELTGIITQRLVEDADIGGPNSTLQAEALTGCQGQSVSDAFHKDANRINLHFDGVHLLRPDHTVTEDKACSDFAVALRAKGLSANDVERLTPFVAQNTAGIFLQTITNPYYSELRLPDGQQVGPIMNLSTTFDVRSNNDGTYQIKYSGRGPLAGVIMFDNPPDRADPTVDRRQLPPGNAVPTGPGSQGSLTFTLTVGPDPANNNELSLRSLDEASFKVDLFAMNGSRLI